MSFAYPKKIFLIKKIRSKFCENTGISCTRYKNWIRFPAPFNIKRPKNKRRHLVCWERWVLVGPLMEQSF